MPLQSLLFSQTGPVSSHPFTTIPTSPELTFPSKPFRVTTNTLVRDLNVAVSRFDDRRIEVIANGLPLWNGACFPRSSAQPSPTRCPS